MQSPSCIILLAFKLENEKSDEFEDVRETEIPPLIHFSTCLNLADGTFYRKFGPAKNVSQVA